MKGSRYKKKKKIAYIQNQKQTMYNKKKKTSFEIEMGLK